MEMKSIDLTNHCEIQEPNKTYVKFHIRLDKNSILDTLKHDLILINGDYYKTPESQLIECLVNKKYGETILTLEKL